MRRRKDARRNYDALVAAAEVEFATSGPDVPLDAVVRRAGVGRGTLYRHFTDRRDLATAVWERRTAEHEVWFAEHGDRPDALAALLVRMAAAQVRTRGVLVVLTRDTEPEGGTGAERLRRLEDRVRTMAGTALARSQAAGRVAADLTVEDVLLVLRMVEGALAGRTIEEAPAVAERVLRLVMPAVTGGPATDLPTFEVPGAAAPATVDG